MVGKILTVVLSFGCVLIFYILFGLKMGTGLGIFFNPKVIYKNMDISYCGAIILSVIMNILAHSIAICYWVCVLFKKIIRKIRK